MRKIEKTMTTKERHAVAAAAMVMINHGIEISMPWDGDIDDLERERFHALVEACRIYRDRTE